MTQTPTTWDTHAHVIDNRFPLTRDRDYTPKPAPLADYLAMLDRHGIARGVLVQPSVYGFDNRCLLDALDRADGRLVGVAVPAASSSRREIQALHRRGVRGVRCNLVNSGGLEPEVLLRWQPVLQELGWHVELQIAVTETTDLRAFLEPFKVPIIIDHIGRPQPGRLDPSEPGLNRLVQLVEA